MHPNLKRVVKRLAMQISSTVLARHARGPEFKTLTNNCFERERESSPGMSPLNGGTIPSAQL